MAVRPIIDTLRELRRGAMLDEAAALLAEVVQHVTSVGKPGKLIVSLTVKPAGKGSLRTLMIEDALETKLPKPDREITVFFPTSEGNLSRTDPSQLDLQLRSVPPPIDARVDLSTGEILAQ